MSLIAQGVAISVPTKFRAQVANSAVEMTHIIFKLCTSGEDGGGIAPLHETGIARIGPSARPVSGMVLAHLSRTDYRCVLELITEAISIDSRREYPKLTASTPVGSAWQLLIDFYELFERHAANKTLSQIVDYSKTAGGNLNRASIFLKTLDGLLHNSGDKASVNRAVGYLDYLQLGLIHGDEGDSSLLRRLTSALAFPTVAD